MYTVRGDNETHTVMTFVMNKTLVPSREFVLDRWLAYPPLSRTTSLVMAGVLCVTMVAGAFGNTLVIIVYAKYKSLRTTPNTFVINLTAVDLLMCVLCFPILIANCFRGHMDDEFLYFFCNLDAFIGALTGFVSIFSLVALAIDRYVVISRKFPMSFPTDRGMVQLAIFLIWLTCGTFSALPVFGFGRYVLEGSQLSCTFDYFTRSTLNIAYNVTIQLTFFVIPVITIAFCYVYIFYKVRTHERTYFRKRNSRDFDEVALRRIRKSRKLEKNELKTARAAVILIGVFSVSWLPYSIVSWIGLFGDSSGITPLMVAIPAVLAKASTVINPVLYVFSNNNFLRKIKLLFTNVRGSRTIGQLSSFAGSVFMRSYKASTLEQNVPAETPL